MLAVAILVFPLPLTLRRYLFKIYERLWAVVEVRTIIRVISLLVGILFADALRSTFKFDTSKRSYQLGSETMARRFYAQRNLYITGAIIFLTLAIPSVFTIVRRLIKYEELKIQSKDPKVIEARVKELTTKLKSKQNDIDTLKKQKSGLEKSYDLLADQLHAYDKEEGDKKSN